MAFTARGRRHPGRPALERSRGPSGGGDDLLVIHRPSPDTSRIRDDRVRGALARGPGRRWTGRMRFEEMWADLATVGRSASSVATSGSRGRVGRGRAAGVVRRGGHRARAAAGDRRARQRGRLVGRRGRSGRAHRVAPRQRPRRRGVRRPARRRLGAGGGRPAARAGDRPGPAARDRGLRRGGGGPRFGLACLGSRLATGALAWESAIGLRDRDGVALGDGWSTAATPFAVARRRRLLRGAPRRAGPRPRRA